MIEDILLQAMVAAVRYSSARQYFSDMPDAKMKNELRKIVKPEWLVKEEPEQKFPEPVPEHRGPGRPRKV